jgi:uncharacterized protein
MLTDTDLIIAQTKKWITDVVVGCNFCPFAAREVKRESIYYEVLPRATLENVLPAVARVLQQLEEEPGIETALLILPEGFETFTRYLEMVDLSESLLEQEGYEGVFQLASFHPDYLFAGTTDDDPSNYTNRSPYAMLHFLREETVSKAVDNYPGIDDVPDNNIEFTQEKGLIYMKQLLASCMNPPS